MKKKKKNSTRALTRGNRKKGRLPAPEFRSYSIFASVSGNEEREDRGIEEYVDPLDVQLSVKLRVPKGRKISRKLIIQAIKFRAAHGRDPQGFTIKIARWRNPGRVNLVDRQWRGMKGRKGGAESQTERFDTLGRALRGSRMVYKISSSRKTRTPGRPAKALSRFRQKAKGKRRARVRGSKKNRTARKMAPVRKNKKGVSRSRVPRKKARAR